MKMETKSKKLFTKKELKAFGDFCRKQANQEFEKDRKMYLKMIARITDERDKTIQENEKLKKNAKRKTSQGKD